MGDRDAADTDNNQNNFVIDPTLLAHPEPRLDRQANLPETTQSDTGEQTQLGYETFLEMLEQVQTHVPFDDQLVISANSAVLAADILYDSLHSFYFSELSRSLPATMSVRNLTSASLNAPDCRIYV
jgi:hypothetical protein